MTVGAHDRNGVAGSLSDDCIGLLLTNCREQLLTCSIQVDSDGRKGVIEILSGTVERASFGDMSGNDAVSAMSTLIDGHYSLTQRVPDLSGEMSDSGYFEGLTAETALTKVMRHCEDNALSCVVTVNHGSDEAQISYRLGELGNVFWNGERDDDKIVDIMDLKDATFRVSAPPLELAEGTWPGILADMPRPKAVSIPVPAPAPAPVAVAAPKPAPQPTPKPVTAAPPVLAPAVVAPAPAPAAAKPARVARASEKAPAPVAAIAKVAAPAPQAQRPKPLTREALVPQSNEDTRVAQSNKVKVIAGVAMTLLALAGLLKLLLG